MNIYNYQIVSRPKNIIEEKENPIVTTKREKK